MTSPALPKLHYLPDRIGYARFRIRERHVADHLAPLITRGNSAAAKVDLLLRGLARRPRELRYQDPDEAGRLTSHVFNYEIHSLLHPDGDPTIPGGSHDPRTAKSQREWTRRALRTLADLNLVDRDHDNRIRVLRDDGSGELLDDPDGRDQANRYLTINGALFPSRSMAHWGGPEMAFYLCAMIGEAADKYPPDWYERGDGEWFRSLDWFADVDGTRRDEQAIRIPFSRSTLHRGAHALQQQGFIEISRISQDPDTGRPFAQGGFRNRYKNWFESKARQQLHGQPS